MGIISHSNAVAGGSFVGLRSPERDAAYTIWSTTEA
jgi:hypothetical protein